MTLTEAKTLTFFFLLLLSIFSKIPYKNKNYLMAFIEWWWHVHELRPDSFFGIENKKNSNNTKYKKNSFCFHIEKEEQQTIYFCFIFDCVQYVSALRSFCYLHYCLCSGYLRTKLYLIIYLLVIKRKTLFYNKDKLRENFKI